MGWVIPPSLLTGAGEAGTFQWPAYHEAEITVADGHAGHAGAVSRDRAADSRRQIDRRLARLVCRIGLPQDRPRAVSADHLFLPSRSSSRWFCTRPFSVDAFTCDRHERSRVAIFGFAGRSHQAVNLRDLRFDDGHRRIDDDVAPRQRQIRPRAAGLGAFGHHRRHVFRRSGYFR